MPTYTGLASIPDPATRQVIKLLMDQIGTLQQQVAALQTTDTPLTTALDFNSQRGLHLADPQVATDAVNLQTLQRYVGAATATPPTTPPAPGP